MYSLALGGLYATVESRDGGEFGMWTEAREAGGVYLDFCPGDFEFNYKGERARMSMGNRVLFGMGTLGLGKFRPGRLHFQSLIAGRLAKCSQKRQIKLLFNNKLFTSGILLSQTNI